VLGACGRPRNTKLLADLAQCERVNPFPLDPFENHLGSERHASFRDGGELWLFLTKPFKRVDSVNSFEVR
jgi:hypothetical protein